MSENKAELNIKARIAELTNVNRIVTNTLSLITDVDIKGGHAVPVAEILGWLSSFSKSLTTQIQALEASLPKEETVKPLEVIEAEVVKV